MTDFRQRTWEKFESLMVRQDENQDEICRLQDRVNQLKQLDISLNAQVCALGEVLGIEDLDAAANALGRRREAALAKAPDRPNA